MVKQAYGNRISTSPSPILSYATMMVIKDFVELLVRNLLVPKIHEPHQAYSPV